MQETKELNALFTLIDDPDEEVYSTVSQKIVGYGKPIIPIWNIYGKQPLTKAFRKG